MEANDQHLYFKLLSVNTFILQALQTDSDVCMRIKFGKGYLLVPSAYHNWVMQSVILCTNKCISISTCDYQKCSLNYPLQTEQGVEMTS